jgi:hypothetical protein
MPRRGGFDAETRRRRKEERAAVIIIDDVRREISADLQCDVDALLDTPAYGTEDFVSDLRRYVAKLRLFEALRPLLGQVTRGPYEDAVAVFDHESGSPKDIARRVAAGEFDEHRRWDPEQTLKFEDAADDTA